MDYNTLAHKDRFRHSVELHDTPVYYKQVKTPSPNEWIYFVGYERDGPLPDLTTFGDDGPKVHVSMGAFNPDAMRELAEVGMKYGIVVFKLSPPEDFFSNAKTGTFYYSENGVDGRPIDWEGFMRSVEVIGRKYGVAVPHPKETSLQFERRVPGSKMVTYRFDKSQDGTYIEIDHLDHIPESSRFNPYNLKDPLGDIDITHARGAHKEYILAAEVEALRGIEKLFMEARRKLPGTESNGTGDSLRATSLLLRNFIEGEVPSAMAVKNIHFLLTKVDKNAAATFRTIAAEHGADPMDPTLDAINLAVVESGIALAAANRRTPHPGPHHSLIRNSGNQDASDKESPHPRRDISSAGRDHAARVSRAPDTDFPGSSGGRRI